MHKKESVRQLAEEWERATERAAEDKGDEVVVPLQAEADAVESTALLLEHLKRLEKIGFNPRLAVSGLLFTQVNMQTRLHQDAMAFARQVFDPYVNFFNL